MCETCTHEMTAAVVRGKGAPFALEKATIRAPLGDEVLVRIVATGMCHTDMIVQDQYYPVPLPAVLGHEGAGVVEAVGPEVKSLAKGDHVILSFGWCGVCPQCKAGTFSYCQKFFEQNFIGISPNGPDTVKDADGATLTSNFFSQSSFATLAIAREGNAVKVPHEAPLEILGPPGCGIQTGAGAVMNSLKVPAGASIAIFGGGAVGLSAVLAAKAVGAATIIVVDIVPSRLALAQDLGATHVLNGKEADPVAEIKALTGAGVDFSLESTGLPPVARQAIDALGSRGVCGIVGAPPLGTPASFDVNDLILLGKSIRGIVEGDSDAKVFIPKLVDLYLQGKFAFDRLVRTYPAAEINEAAADSKTGVTLKPVIRFGDLA